MKAAPFAYHRARSIDEAVCMLGELAPRDGRILAGGQSLVPIMAFRLSRPAHLIDINAIAALDRLERNESVLRIGATVRHAAFERGSCTGTLGMLLSGVARQIAHAPIRRRGTFCGSLAHSDPASEWCLVFATLDGAVVARSVRGERRIAAEGFFTGIMATALEPDELLTATELALLPDDGCWGFYEHSRRAGDYAMAMTLAGYRLVEGRMVAPRIGLGGVEAVPRRIVAAEQELDGREPGDSVFDRAACAAAAAIVPLEDGQADAALRRDLARATTRRALRLAAAAPVVGQSRACPAAPPAALASASATTPLRSLACASLATPIGARSAAARPSA